ncbi:BRO family protein [uncultured Parabacteroides sp.]|uniref:BRO family protein n=1 Tax=uncultured Parabacteroides sp. TaxID=512312 RepID=UPI0025D5FFBD|nr:phage antirepressor KilAC domain-containing protein [uncultured Parabacteroides sp.]
MLDTTNEIQIFNSTQFGEIRTIEVNNQPYFVGNDVALALGYAKPRNAILQHVDKEDALKQGIPDSQGFVQETTLINESGVYSLVFGSKLDTAKAFKRWVTSEVLPAIRKTGGYITTKADDTPEEIMARALTIAQATLAKREERLKQLESDNQQKDAKIAKLQPKADFADAAFTTDDKVDIGMAAKILKLGFGRNTLFQKLRQVGVFFSNRNEPKQRFVNAGYFEMKEKFIERNSHPGFVVTKILVTQKGLAYINHLFGGNPSDGKIAAIK